MKMFFLYEYFFKTCIVDLSRTYLLSDVVLNEFSLYLVHVWFHINTPEQCPQTARISDTGLVHD